ncbi:hypothetical protein EJB05_11351 [Eragrostis curvula]|uniref:HMA domain-containing protein n=1 Tax=Eragrostis curvula TaxID=38414 RepID=A0A5J9VRG8_9POAL|nr:hypothetical protein EJB05_11351 [Eragrostis curvula]
MGEKDNKISTIVLKVDLECQRCYKKIRKALCKIQDKMEIKTISYDEKSNSVTISGPFDAEKVCRKLCCKAGRVIKDMSIKGKEAKADGGEKAAAAKPADKDGGKAEKPKDGKADKEAGKAEKKDGKADKAEKKEGKADKEKGKDDKAEKKVKFADGDGKPAAEAKAVKAIPPADLGPLLEKIMAAKGAAPPAAPCGEPIKQPVAAQGVAVPSIWPAPAASMAGYSYNPSYDPSYYGAGGGYGRLPAVATEAAGQPRRRPADTTACPCTTTRVGTTAAAAQAGSRTTRSSSSRAARTPTPGSAASCDGAMDRAEQSVSCGHPAMASTECKKTFFPVSSCSCLCLWVLVY